MPVQRIALELAELKEAILAAGYGITLSPGDNIRLTKKGKVLASGRMLHDPLIPVSSSQVQRILYYAENIQDALNQVIAISLGEIKDPNLPEEHKDRGGGLDSQTMERVIQSRTEAEIAKLREADSQRFADMEDKIGKLVQINQQLAQMVDAAVEGVEAGKKPAVQKKLPPKVKKKEPAVPPVPLEATEIAGHSSALA